MGLCLGTEVTEEEKKARIHSARIDRELYECAKREMNVVKILLLGETDNPDINSPDRGLSLFSFVPESVHIKWFKNLRAPVSVTGYFPAEDMI